MVLLIMCWFRADYVLRWHYLLVQSWLCAPMALSTGSKLTMCSEDTIYWFKADYVLRWHYLLLQSWLCAPMTLSTGSKLTMCSDDTTGSKLTMCSDDTIYWFKADYVLRWHYLLVQSWICAPMTLSTGSKLTMCSEGTIYYLTSKWWFRRMTVFYGTIIIHDNFSPEE
jgi:hypothetical protein